MGVHVGKAVGTKTTDQQQNHGGEVTETAKVERLFPPTPPSKITSSETADEELRDQPALTLVACPLGDTTESEAKKTPVGMYNARALAGRALSLTTALSPDYMQAYVSGLEDLISLERLPETNRRRR